MFFCISHVAISDNAVIAIFPVIADIASAILISIIEGIFDGVGRTRRGDTVSNTVDIVEGRASCI